MKFPLKFPYCSMGASVMVVLMYALLFHEASSFEWSNIFDRGKSSLMGIFNGKAKKEKQASVNCEAKAKDLQVEFTNKCHDSSCFKKIKSSTNLLIQNGCLTEMTNLQQKNIGSSGSQLVVFAAEYKVFEKGQFKCFVLLPMVG